MELASWAFFLPLANRPKSSIIARRERFLLAVTEDKMPTALQPRHDRGFVMRCSSIAREAVRFACKHAAHYDLDRVDERVLFFAIAFGREGIARYLLGLPRTPERWPTENVTLKTAATHFADFADDETAGQRYEHIVRLALEEPRKRNDGTVDTSDLLVAFVADTPGVTARVLQRFSLDESTIRARINEWRGEDFSHLLWPDCRIDQPPEWPPGRFWFTNQPRHWWKQEGRKVLSCSNCSNHGAGQSGCG